MRYCIQNPIDPATRPRPRELRLRLSLRVPTDTTPAPPNTPSRSPPDMSPVHGAPPLPPRGRRSKERQMPLSSWMIGRALVRSFLRWQDTGPNIAAVITFVMRWCACPEE
ncbi:hypothetical protein ZHAS_00009446 [Anopheles sinensis]|uniref:Uncharacterized protein n=1 Tax=Anopheles sinensis TaxID=74873 RepID=A0A084VV93_ANOSI|nr:hypothetical protein ZHAS_00009446 [Anopheles sinensis]